jgi:hypothetical protein
MDLSAVMWAVWTAARTAAQKAALSDSSAVMWAAQTAATLGQDQ